MFEQLTDIIGEVRCDGQFYSLKEFITPHDPLIMEIASVLNMSDNPITAAQDFVHRIVKYTKQSGEYWRYPIETLEDGETIGDRFYTYGDCDESSTLLCSILRNYLDDVYVAVGNLKNGSNGGHAWLVVRGKIIESTVGSSRKIDEGKYQPSVLFNDRLVFAEPNEFGFLLITGRQFRVM